MSLSADHGPVLRFSAPLSWLTDQTGLSVIPYQLEAYEFGVWNGVTIGVPSPWSANRVAAAVRRFYGEGRKGWELIAVHEERGTFERQLPRAYETTTPIDSPRWWSKTCRIQANSERIA
jgi:hypothetical protein